MVKANPAVTETESAPMLRGLITRINGTGDEISRRNYFGVFPIQYQQSSGFGQFEKLKEKVVLAFDYSQDG